MISITAQDVKPIAPTDGISGSHPQGEQANLIAHGVVIHPALIRRLPETYLYALTSAAGDIHTYSVIVTGYTVQQFIEIVMAFANGHFATGERLIDEIIQHGQER